MRNERSKLGMFYNLTFVNNVNRLLSIKSNQTKSNKGGFLMIHGHSENWSQHSELLPLCKTLHVRTQ